MNSRTGTKAILCVAPAAGEISFKKNFSYSSPLLPLLLVLLLPISLQAQFDYTIENNAVTITGYTGAGGNVTIPDTITGFPVVYVGNSAFAGAALTSLVIPSSVISIGDYAFSYCGSLTNATIGNSVTGIGAYAFYSCNSMTKIFIPDSVITIGGYAFSGCTSLASASIGNGVTSIGNWAFYYCTNLAGVTLGRSLISIGDFAFSWCIKLADVTIPRTVTSLGDYAFHYNLSLTAAYFKGNAPNIGIVVFGGYTDNTVYYLPGTAGWGAMFDGRPTGLWRPRIETNDGNFGVRTNRFGFNVTWTSGMAITVDACTNLSLGPWSPLQTNILTGDSLYFSDPSWTNHSTRIYRIRWP